MKTLIYSEEKDMCSAAEILRSGGMAAVPTETVYGLCVNGLDEHAVDALYEIKGRPEVKPLSLMIPSLGAASRFCRSIPGAAYALAERFWPGPLTLILPADTDVVPSVVRAGGDTIGLRCPDHPLTLALLEKTGFPLAGPSANPSGKPSPKTAQEVLRYFNGAIEAVIDGGPCGIGQESTIADLSRIPFRILRQGALPEEEIWACLRQNIRVVGITGGTGTGKTTALRLLEKRGALTLDCDAIYHELLESCTPLLSDLKARFPGAFSSGTLDRKALGRIVFRDADALSDLNSITHAYVADEVEKRLLAFSRQGGTLAAIDAIALFESGLAGKCCCTIGVLAEESTRLERIMKRENISREYALSRIRAQADNSFFASLCTHSIHNDGTPEEFEKTCQTLFDSIL